MDFANERYVRLFVHDTTTWVLLGFEGQTMLMHLLRKADRSGVIDIGNLEPWQAGVVLCRAPENIARPGLAKCLELGVIAHDVDRLVFPRFLEANECPMSGAQRSRESRARRAVLTQNVSDPTRNVTPPTRNVSLPTRGDTPRHSFFALPSLPSDLYESEIARARASQELGREGTDLESDRRRGSDFMLNATARSWQKADEDLALIGAKPEAERARALAAIRADAWCQANMTRVSPAHVLRKWNHYAAGAPPTKAVKSDTDEAQQWRAKVQDSAQALDALRKRRRELQRDDPNYLALVYELDEKIRQENDQLERRKRELNALTG